MKHDTPVSEARFFPDGERVVTAGWDGKPRLWDAKTGLPLTEWLEGVGHLGRIACCVDSTGNRVAAGGALRVVRVWEVPTIPAPVPDWFPTFAEAVAGIRLSPRGHLEVVPQREFEATIQKLGGKEGGQFHVDLARWFLADPFHRPPVPRAFARD